MTSFYHFFKREKKIPAFFPSFFFEPASLRLISGNEYKKIIYLYSLLFFQVNIKLTTSVGAREGLRVRDRSGYTATLPHFLFWLRHRNFTAFLQKCRGLLDYALEDQREKRAKVFQLGAFGQTQSKSRNGRYADRHYADAVERDGEEEEQLTEDPGLETTTTLATAAANCYSSSLDCEQPAKKKKKYAA
jgi:hypothetical protein